MRFTSTNSIIELLWLGLLCPACFGQLGSAKIQLPFFHKKTASGQRSFNSIILTDLSNHSENAGGVLLIINRKLTAVYTILGVNIEGRKEVLGLYISENEGANFWLQVLTDLSNRGVNDILIACVDGLKGFPEAIETIFPETEVQLCVVHQIRNSLKYVGSKNQKEFMADLKRVYKAVNKELAESELDVLENKWNDKYPIVIKSWRNNWERLSQYFKYPEEIRRIIYTTNTIEAVHRQFRKLTKTKGAFPNQDSLLKLLYMGIQNASKKWTMPVQNWSLTISQLAIFFEGRLDKELKI